MAVDGPRPALRTIRLLPVALPDDAVATELVARLSRLVSLPCQLEPAVEGADLAAVAGRDQLDADALLAALEDRAARPGEALVGITGRDIGNSIFAFFFGLARHAGHAALVSLHRLDPAFYGLRADHELMLRRAVTELLHELGHVAGLVHCDDAACLMHFAPTVEALDVRGAAWCASCSARLPRGLRGPHAVV